MQSNKALIQKQILNLDCDSNLDVNEISSLFKIFVEKEINVIIEQELDALGIYDDVEIPSLILDLGEVEIDDDLNEVKQKVQRDIREGLKDIRSLIQSSGASLNPELEKKRDNRNEGSLVHEILKRLAQSHVPLNQWYPKLMEELEALGDDNFKQACDILNDFMRLELNDVFQSKADGLSSGDIYRRLIRTFSQQDPNFSEVEKEKAYTVEKPLQDKQNVSENMDVATAEDLPTAAYLQRTRLVTFILDTVLENLHNPQLFTRECLAKYESTFGHRLDEKYIHWIETFEKDYGNAVDMLRGNINHLKKILSDDKEQREEQPKKQFDTTLILGEDMLQDEGSAGYEWKQKIRNDVALQMQKLIVIMRDDNFSLLRENAEQWSSLCSSAYTHQFKETLKEWILNRIFKFQQYIRSNTPLDDEQNYSEVLIRFLQDSYHESFSNSYLPLKLLEVVEGELADDQSTDGYLELDEASEEASAKRATSIVEKNVERHSSEIIKDHKKIRVQIRRVQELLASGKDPGVLNIYDSEWMGLMQKTYQAYYNEKVCSWIDEKLDAFRKEFVNQNKKSDQAAFLIKHFLDHQYKVDVLNTIENVDYLQAKGSVHKNGDDNKGETGAYSSKSEIKNIIKKHIPLIVRKLNENEDILTDKSQFVSVVMEQLDGLIKVEDQEYIVKRVERYFNLQSQHYFLNTADDSTPVKPKLANVYLETLNTDFTDEQTSEPRSQEELLHNENLERKANDVEDFSEQILEDLLDVVELSDKKESLRTDSGSNIEPLFKVVNQNEESEDASLQKEKRYDVDPYVDKIYWHDPKTSDRESTWLKPDLIGLKKETPLSGSSTPISKDKANRSESNENISLPKTESTKVNTDNFSHELNVLNSMSGINDIKPQFFESKSKGRVSDEINQIQESLLTFIQHIRRVLKEYLANSQKRYETKAWQPILEQLLEIEKSSAEEKVLDEIIVNFKSAYLQSDADYDKVGCAKDVLYLLELYLTHNTRVYSTGYGNSDSIDSGTSMSVGESNTKEVRESIQKATESLGQNKSESKRILMVVVERLSTRNIAVSKWFEVLKSEYQRSTQHSIPADLLEDVQVFIRHVLPGITFNPLQNNESNTIFVKLYAFLKGHGIEAKKTVVEKSAFQEELLPQSKVISAVRKKVNNDAQGVADDLIPIYNIGLVILWPYLGRFLKNLGYIEENEFVSEKHRRQCALLLHYLATGDTAFDEAELFLPKVLCELDPATPLADEYLELDSSMEIACEELLFSCMKNWAALKTNSISFFRNGFMKRNGLARMLHIGWQIEVERMNQDVLLSRLPWTIGIVKLPWMKKPVSVTWNPF